MLGRVTARLSSNPVLPPNRWPVCLDAIVAWRVMRAELGHRFGTGTLTAADCAATDALDLPFERLDFGGEWVWAASHVMPAGDGEAVEWQHSRNDLSLYERRVPVEQQVRVDEARAVWKPVRLPRVVTVTTRVSWLVDSPDPDRLMGILGEVVAVGKNWSRGSGQVASWQWSPVDVLDWGPGLRPLPQPGSGLDAGIRPPYHHRAQRREVAVP